jgi:hypothetical protein
MFRAAQETSSRYASHDGAATRKCRLAGILLVLVLAQAAVPPAGAQISSARPTVNLRAVINPRLAVVVTPGNVNFILPFTGGVSNGSAPLLITTAWSLPRGTNNVTLWAYFSTAASALSNGANNIPSSRVRGSVNGGAFNAFTRNSPFGAARSLRIFRQPIRNNNRIGQRNDTLDLRINTVGLPLSPGTYTGVLLIQARAL